MVLRSCTTYNIIYLFLCIICTKPYVGRTVSSLNIRANQHRSAFYKVLKFSNNSELNESEFDNDSDDIYSLNLKVNAKILAWLLREAFNISLNIVISSKMK